MRLRCRLSALEVLYSVSNRFTLESLYELRNLLVVESDPLQQLMTNVHSWCVLITPSMIQSISSSAQSQSIYLPESSGYHEFRPISLSQPFSRSNQSSLLGQLNLCCCLLVYVYRLSVSLSIPFLIHSVSYFRVFAFSILGKIHCHPANLSQLIHH
jgi:hypothetical protein